MGYISWADQVGSEDALVVASLRKAGAIIFVKTTMPQSGMVSLRNVNEFSMDVLADHPLQERNPLTWDVLWPGARDQF